MQCRCPPRTIGPAIASSSSGRCASQSFCIDVRISRQSCAARWAGSRAFQGTLVGTVLGNAISVHAHGADFAALAIVVALAVFAIADVLYLNLRERAAEFASLRAVGWADSHLARVVLFEAVGLGLLGTISGAIVGVLIGALVLSVPVASLAVAAAIAIADGLACVLLASLVPLSQVNRLTPHAVLAEE
jgi:putative ABC transport system permease protein